MEEASLNNTMKSEGDSSFCSSNLSPPPQKQEQVRFSSEVSVFSLLIWKVVLTDVAGVVALLLFIDLFFHEIDCFKRQKNFINAYF